MEDSHFSEIEKKWRKRWDEAKLSESDIDPRREKFYLTVAYPYPSGAMHVGHARTYTVPDVIARFKRMQGFNVLFPMAWHVTGTPIIGISKRIERREEKAIKQYRDLYKVPEKVLESFTDPHNVYKYFVENDYRPNMQRLGYTIDWRRQFTTTERHYQKFITWMYLNYYDKGLIEKGEHPIRFCPSCNNPVGDHDLLQGEKASIDTFTIVKFRFDGKILPAATFRQETVFGVTNMWVNPDLTYLIAKVGHETWILSKEAFDKLRHQNKEMDKTGEISGRELLNKRCINPVNGQEVEILPASFVDPDYGTGVVMSVPGHAPYDYVALRDLGKSDNIISIIKVPGYGDFPAKEIVESMKIENQNDFEKLEKATHEIYKAEHAKGVMKDNCGEYSGMRVSDAREALVNDLGASAFDSMFEFLERPVVCRCGTNITIQILKDQWFLKYGDPDWKELARRNLSEMWVVPGELRKNFEHYIGWLDNWPCTRKLGLGTVFPFDETQIIEPLSDSTVYMAFYTIKPFIYKIDPEKLSREVFDYIFLKRNDLVGNFTSEEQRTLEEARRSFSYWYPMDARLSAKDLVGNHLSFMIFHHTALFNEAQWPKGIVVFGMGLMEGQKMSSSKGNVVLLKDALEKFGSDAIRLFLMSNAEPWQDFDWREAEIMGVVKNLKRLKEFVYSINDFGTKSSPVDDWLLSKLQVVVNTMNDALENYQTRKALQAGFFEVFSLLKWYERRGGNNRVVLREFMETWIKLLGPFIPYTCDELWEALGNKGFVLEQEYPRVDEQKINEEIELSEDLIVSLLEDVNKITEVTKISPKKCIIYIAPEWKYKLFEEIDSGKQIKELMQNDEYRKRGKEIASLFNKQRSDKIRYAKRSDEIKLFEDAKEFLKTQLNCEVEISIDASYDPAGRSRFALPGKPGVYVE